jgi:adenosylcobinamide kinase/adenosylcobinamide-phosphate guanylyltransferase
MLTLVLGGARSGKSSYAEQLAIKFELPVTYIATATGLDDEMKLRIEHHQRSRPKEWRTIECPLNLVDLIAEQSRNQQTILIDCLTLWINNQLFHNPNQNFSNLFSEFIQVCKDSEAHIIFVANEVGLGIIPLGEISRKFVDEAGRLNQALAKVADDVIFIAAGLPLILKQSTVYKKP